MYDKIRLSYNFVKSGASKKISPQTHPNKRERKTGFPGSGPPWSYKPSTHAKNMMMVITAAIIWIVSIASSYLNRHGKNKKLDLSSFGHLGLWYGGVSRPWPKSGA
jgi:hypothetical protein